MVDSIEAAHYPETASNRAATDGKRFRASRVNIKRPRRRRAFANVSLAPPRFVTNLGIVCFARALHRRESLCVSDSQIIRRWRLKRVFLRPRNRSESPAMRASRRVSSAIACVRARAPYVPPRLQKSIGLRRVTEALSNAFPDFPTDAALRPQRRCSLCKTELRPAARRRRVEARL